MTTSGGGRSSLAAFSRRVGPSSPTPTTTTRTTRPRRSIGSWRSGAEGADGDPRHLQYGLALQFRPREGIRLDLAGRLRRGRDHDGRTLGYPPGRLSQGSRREARPPDFGAPPSAPTG